MERGTILIRVSGAYACFTRPEFKVERVSYPVITPSAARGVLEAVFWRPEMRYQVRRIGVLKLGSQMVLLRNELSERQGSKPVVIEAQRQQRSSLILTGVSYLIEAAVILRPHAIDPLPKYLDQIERRVRRGQCHHTPYLGTRECVADFAPVNGERPPDFTLEIGTMLFDQAFVESRTRKELAFRRPPNGQPVEGYAQPVFFDGRVEGGWLTVPPEKYAEVYRLEGDRV